MKLKLILAFSTTYFSLVSSLVAFAGNNQKSVRWTYKEDNNSDFVHIIDVINQKHFQTFKHVFQKGKNSYAGFFLSETGFFFQFQKLEKIWWELAWYLRKTTKMIGGYLTGRWCLTVTVRHIFLFEKSTVFFST